MTRARAGRGLAGRLPVWLENTVSPEHRESDAVFYRRRRVVAGASLAGAGLLGASLSTQPDSPEFYRLTFGVAGIWLGGSLLSGPLHLGWVPSGQTYRRPVVVPIVLGVTAFGAFYGAALVARRVPMLRRAVTSVLQYAEEGTGPLVLLTTLANGAAEELFFRGALFAAVGSRYPVPKSAAVYALATTATRNPALVLASGAMGTLFGLQRRATGGIQAPVLTHLIWSALMLRYLPPLFREFPPTDVPPTATVSAAVGGSTHAFSGCGHRWRAAPRWRRLRPAAPGAA